MKNFSPSIFIAILNVACETNSDGNPGEIPRISVSPNSQSCPEGEVFDPLVQECVVKSDFFENVCDDSTGETLVEVIRAEYCCFTQNNYYYWCPMSPEYNLSLGSPCICPDQYSGVYWNGVACGYGE